MKLRIGDPPTCSLRVAAKAPPLLGNPGRTAGVQSPGLIEAAAAASAGLHSSWPRAAKLLPMRGGGGACRKILPPGGERARVHGGSDARSSRMPRSARLRVSLNRRPTAHPSLPSSAPVPPPPVGLASGAQPVERCRSKSNFRRTFAYRGLRTMRPARPVKEPISSQEPLRGLSSPRLTFLARFCLRPAMDHLISTIDTTNPIS